MTIDIHLKWQGPFWLDTPSNREKFSPPERPGVYLWCVGGKKCPYIAYIGQSGNIQLRLYDHITYMFGGRYHLYSDPHLLDGKPPDLNTAYVSDREDYIDRCIGKSKEFTALALRNLMSFGFFWATISSEEALIRNGVESALITEAKQANAPLQNWNSKISCASHRCPPLRIMSSFKRGFSMSAIRHTISYGTSM